MVFSSEQIKQMIEKSLLDIKDDIDQDRCVMESIAELKAMINKCKRWSGELNQVENN